LFHVLTCRYMFIEKIKTIESSCVFIYFSIYLFTCSFLHSWLTSEQFLNKMTDKTDNNTLV
jgi:hypothetical protein